MTNNEPTQTDPRISVTKLGEYTDATAARRRTIVRNQREPSPFIVTRYGRARSPLVDYFVEGTGDPLPIIRQAKSLASATGSSGWTAEDLHLSAEALESFVDARGDFDLGGLVAAAGHHSPPKLPISGVQVSVRPDLILRGEYRKKNVVGAIKFHFSKAGFLTEDAGLNIATVIHQYAEANMLREGETASLKHCVVLDVFAKKWYSAPAAYTRRRRTVTDACQEVALWWRAA